MSSENASTSSEPQFADGQFEGKSFYELCDVRIYPKGLIFQNAFEGKKFKETIYIQNVGKAPVTIRIFQASSSALRFKKFQSGKFLAPGLSIKRTINFTVCMSTLVKTVFLYIHIDKEILKFVIKIYTSRALLTVEPRELNFGIVDAGPRTTKRELKLFNYGYIPARFAIDLGTNEYGISINPTKGIVMERNHVKLRVELSILTEGIYNTEFWIISDNPMPVKVSVTVIHGEIEAINNIALRDFVFILFPRIYYGTKSFRSLVLRNKSQCNSIFHCTGELNRISIHFNEAKELDFNYNYFDITPASGRLPPNDVRSFLFTFTPIFDPRKSSGYNDTFLIAMNIHKLYCTDLDNSRYDDEIFDDSLSSVNLINVQSMMSSNDNLFATEFEDNLGDVNVPMLPNESFFENTIRVLLYGNAELPSVSIVPDEITLTNLILKETICRVIQLSNNSQNLPIIYRYKKIAFVDIVPKSGILKPLEKKEISVYITHQSYYVVESELEFELLYYDNPNINKTVTVIGTTKLSIFIQAKIVTKEKMGDGILATNFDFKKPNIRPNTTVFNMLVNENALLALPNDRPTSIRPWHGTQTCRTIYAAMPRIANVPDEYQLTLCEYLKKFQTREYYRNYTRQQAIELTKHSFLNNDDNNIYVKNKCVRIHLATKDSKIAPSFIPLSPAQLYDITIKPRNWIVENVIPHSEFTNFLEIINNNNVSLRLYLKPHKSSQFRFPKGNRAEVNANSKHTMYFSCCTNKVGIEYHTLDVIINENHIFETSFTINVLPRTLLLSFTEAIFHSTDKLYKYLQISNEYNGPIDFVWEFVGDLNIEPMSGSVKAKSALTCMISYEIGNTELNNYELIIRVDNRRNQSVRILLDTVNIDVGFIDEIDFGEVSIAVPTVKYAPMYNKTEEYLWFTVMISDVLNGLTVEPMKGCIPPKGVINFAIKLECYNMGPFQAELLFLISNIKELTVKTKGNVRFPSIQITPQDFKFKRIAASSFDIQCLTLINEDTIPAVIQFDVERYPELHFSEYSDSDFIVAKDTFTLLPEEQKIFSVHFYPSFSFATYYLLPLIINTFNHGTSAIIMPYLKMYAAVLPHRVYIHTWKYYFTYYPHFGYKSTTSQIIHIKTSTYVKFCIRLDEVDDPFYIKHYHGGQITNYTYSIVCELNPDEEAAFEVTFSPHNFGVYEIRLPFFIKDDLSTDLHNYFYFNGVFHQPTIIFPDTCIHFGIIPLNMTTEKEVEITLQYHNPNCALKIFSSDINVMFDYTEQNVNSSTVTLKLSIRYCSDSMHTLNTHIHLDCNCGSSIDVPVIGGAENCFFSNYACVQYFKIVMGNEDFTFSNKSWQAESRTSLYSAQSAAFVVEKTAEYNYESSFPFFPTADEPYTKYMEDVVNIMEWWIYEHGFYGVQYHTIPDTISLFTIIDFKMKIKTKTFMIKMIDLPYYLLLHNLCGNMVTKLFNLRINKNDIVVMRLFYFYSDVQIFLQRLGGVVPHIKPEYLLPYEEYCNYKKLINKISVPSDRFYLRSKQCWLDLLLQTYKCVVYKRMPINLTSASSSISFKKSVASNNYSNTGFNNDNIYSTEGIMIMNWLNKHLKDYKDYMIRHICTQPSGDHSWFYQKTIQNYDIDLSDGLAFCAITLHYCPYLKEYLKGMHEEPLNDEEKFHNAYLLINAWEMLRIRFQLQPTHLIKPNQLRMFFFLTYMYEFLIYIKPKEGLQFTAPLCSTATEHIYISNQNKQTIKYFVYFFGNTDGVFTLSSNKISLLPDNACQLAITYHAKFLRKAQATLILSGEFKGRRCMQSKAFNLFATPQLTNPIKVINLDSTLYRRKKFCLEMLVPYKEKTEFNLVYTTVDVSKYEDPSEVPLQSFKSNSTMARIILDRPSFETTNRGELKMCGWVCSITNNERIIHTFGKSPIGDFYIVIAVKCKPKNTSSIINLNLSIIFATANCICKKKHPPNVKCPRNIIIKVPSRNEIMWKCIMAQFLQDADEADMEFWQANRDSIIGIDLLKRILNDNKSGINDEMQYIFKRKNKYDINSNNKQVILQPQLEICNTTATTDTTNMVVHLTTNIDSFLFTMMSIDGLEFRNYKVVITYDRE